MLLILPMGGTGRRFQEAGYLLPKPLLKVGGKRLIQLALTSYPSKLKKHYLISLEVALHPSMAGLLPPGCWHALHEPTRGPLYTCLAAKRCLATEEAILIADCDSFIDVDEVCQALKVFETRHVAGGVTIRRTDDPECSYASITSEWIVEETREKDQFTQWSTTGPYWFASGYTFLKAAEKAAHAGHISISPVYNYLEGQTLAVPVSTFRHLGTPDLFEAFKQEVEQGILAKKLAN